MVGALNTVKKLATNKTVVISVVGLVAIIIVYFIVKGSAKGVKGWIDEKKADKAETTDIGQLVQQYRLAMNPSGVSWMMDIDGTDEESIMALGYKTRGIFDPVAQGYKTKFGTNLTDDLRSELDSEEYEAWLEIVDGN